MESNTHRVQQLCNKINEELMIGKMQQIKMANNAFLSHKTMN